MINRRKLLTGAASLAVVPFIPAEAKTGLSVADIHAAADFLEAYPIDDIEAFGRASNYAFWVGPQGHIWQFNGQIATLMSDNLATEETEPWSDEQPTPMPCFP